MLSVHEPQAVIVRRLELQRVGKGTYPMPAVVEMDTTDARVY